MLPVLDLTDEDTVLEIASKLVVFRKSPEYDILAGLVASLVQTAKNQCIQDDGQDPARRGIYRGQQIGLEGLLKAIDVTISNAAQIRAMRAADDENERDQVGGRDRDDDVRSPARAGLFGGTLS